MTGQMVGGSCWKQHISAARQASGEALESVERLQHIITSQQATAYLLKIALRIGTIQGAINSLAEIATKDKLQ